LVTCAAVLVAVASARAVALKEALGDEAEHVRFANMRLSELRTGR